MNAASYYFQYFKLYTLAIKNVIYVLLEVCDMLILTNVYLIIWIL